jgi:hypothetical protein
MAHLEKGVGRDIERTKKDGADLDRSADNLREMDRLIDSMSDSLPAQEARDRDRLLREAYATGQEDYRKWSERHRSDLERLERTRRAVEEAGVDAEHDSRALETAGREVAGSSLERVLETESREVKNIRRDLERVVEVLRKSIGSESRRKGYGLPDGRHYRAGEVARNREKARRDAEAYYYRRRQREVEEQRKREQARQEQEYEEEKRRRREDYDRHRASLGDYRGRRPPEYD